MPDDNAFWKRKPGHKHHISKKTCSRIQRKGMVTRNSYNYKVLIKGIKNSNAKGIESIWIQYLSYIVLLCGAGISGC